MKQPQAFSPASSDSSEVGKPSLHTTSDALGGDMTGRVEIGDPGRLPGPPTLPARGPSCNDAARPLGLRAMRLADLKQVMAIEVRCYSHPWSQGNFIDSLVAGYLAEVCSDESGELQAYFVAMAGVDELHLLNISVSPDLQGQGLGRQLMQRLQARASALGLATLWLEVRAGNHRARALYGRLGFSEVGLRRNYYPGVPRREDAVVMRLPVALPCAPATPDGAGA